MTNDTPTPAARPAAVAEALREAEEETFDVWFEQYRMQTWLSAGCDKGRGPVPSAAWGLGGRSGLLRGWLARAALALPPEAPADTFAARLAEDAKGRCTLCGITKKMALPGNCVRKGDCPLKAAPAAVEVAAAGATGEATDLLTVAHIESEDGAGTLTLEFSQLGDLASMVGEDEATYTVRIAGMMRADFEALGDFDGF